YQVIVAALQLLEERDKHYEQWLEETREKVAVGIEQANMGQLNGNFEYEKFASLCKKIIDSKNLIISKIFEDDELNNQGLELYLNQKSSYWENLRFHSEAEIKIAQALDRMETALIQ
ncbi:MAG: hypothetical protein ACKPCI_04095, partial [Dolichospermum sp.]